ncbi:hypothetical protein ILUMI_15487 [Ignelater luminosus]|uniref:Uncharacterized protein n=1 Tax=Ignelater luminosus TaxID=2038154 RepID=A0A8K0G9G8_IGNLU|nr:hypothetical protein ILUMI_15487 [Ignelater luminosus]
MAFSNPPKRPSDGSDGTLLEGKFNWKMHIGEIRNPPNLLNTFVGNRVSEIQSLIEGIPWNYVDTKNNPADLASRGVFSEALIHSRLWWNGLMWSSVSRLEWPQQHNSLSLTDLPECRKKGLVFIATEGCSFPFASFSNLTKLREASDN